MHKIARSLSARSRRGKSANSTLHWAVELFVAWRTRSRDRRILRSLSDHDLADMGIPRDQIDLALRLGRSAVQRARR